MGKRRYKKEKQKEKKRKALNKKKTAAVFHGYGGNKYDAQGKEQDSDEEQEEIACVYVNQYLKRVKFSTKTEKAKKYLEQFKEGKWKFNKNNQNHILKYIFYDTVFPNDSFKIFKNYIEKMHKETKNKFIKRCEEIVQKYKEDIENPNVMSFKIEGHDLKFSDAEKKNAFLTALHNRCVNIIENC